MNDGLGKRSRSGTGGRVSGEFDAREAPGEEPGPTAGPSGTAVPSSASTGRSAVLHLRSRPPDRGRERSVVEALEALSDAGVLDDVRVETWPESVSLRDEWTRATGFVETFDELETWAAERGVSITPPFVRRTRESTFTGERDEVLLTPVQFLTVHEDGRLVGAYPCRDGDSVATIDDWLGRVGGANPAGDVGGASPAEDRVRRSSGRDG